MRDQLLASVALATLSAGSAFAGPAAPAFTWTGCYVGLHAGADWGHSKWVAGASVTMDGSGAIGGAQAGCNYQVQNFVLGAEGEIWGSGLTESTTLVGAPFSETLTSKSDFAGDLAARLGYAIDRALVFGKVGVAWANYRYADTVDFEGATFLSAEGRSTHTGLLLGLGLEYAIDAHWSLKGEYDYVNYGSKNVPFYFGGNLAFIAAVRNTENLVKVGANYRF